MANAEPLRGPWREPERAPHRLSVDQVRAALAKEPHNETYRRLWRELTGEVPTRAAGDPLAVKPPWT